MTERSGKVRLAGTLLHLVAFGLAAAVIVVLFGVASLSLLGSGNETRTVARVGESGFEARSIPPDVPQSSDDDATSISAEATPDEDAGARSNFEPPLDRKAIVTPEEIPPASPTQSPLTAETHPPELSESQQATTKPLPLGDEVSATPGENASGTTMPAVPIPDEARDQIFWSFQIEHPQPSTLHQANIALHRTAPAQQLQNRRTYDHLTSPNAAFRYRVGRECGPINDPALRRHCIDSFSTHFQ
jgi:hypothetical protein